MTAESLKRIVDHNILPSDNERLQQKLLDGFKAAYNQNDSEILTIFPEAIFVQSVEEANSAFFKHVHHTAAMAA